MGLEGQFSKMEAIILVTGRMIRSADGVQLISLIRKLDFLSKKKEFGMIMVN